MTAVDPAHADFGKYQLLRKLAQGGMAEIFLANQRGIQGFEKLVVLKRVLPDLSASDDFVQMFLDEARIAARLDHANIVRIYDLGEVNGQYYLAMEYIAGEDQASVISQAKKQKVVVPMEYAAEVVTGAAEALMFAHGMEDASGNPMNLVHRDVSPSNIIYTYAGAVKLVDFGIARAESNVSKTDGGQVKGKIQYLSPEQCRTERADNRSDLFALGIVLFELLTCKRLFQRDNPLQTMNAIMKGEVPPLASLRPDVPPELEQIIHRALMTDPELRYQTGAEMAADLSVFLSGTGWVRGAKGIDFLAKLFGEERKKAKLRIARGQRLDEAGYQATMSLPSSAPARPASGVYDVARPGTGNTPGALGSGRDMPSGAHHRPPTSPSQVNARPPSSPSQVNARPPSSPSQVIRTPAPPAINPIEVPRRPSYSQLPAVPGVTPAGLGERAPSPSGRVPALNPRVGAPPAAPSGPRPAIVAKPSADADEDDSEMMKTVSATDLAEMLARSPAALGVAGLPAARPPVPGVPAVTPSAAAPALSPPQRPSYSSLPSQPALSPPQRPSYSSLPSQPALSPPQRPSYSQLPAVPGALSPARPSQPIPPGLVPAPRPSSPQPTAFEQLQAMPASAPQRPPTGTPAPFNVDASARAALFGAPPPLSDPDGEEAPAAVVADAPGATYEVPPEPQLTRPRPSRDLTNAAQELAARIRSSTSSPNLQPVPSPAQPSASPTEPSPAPRTRAMPLVVGLLVAAVVGVVAVVVVLPALRESPAPVEPPPVVVVPPPPPPVKPALEVGGVKFQGMPATAKVSVDGALLANAAAENFLAKGPHRVMVEAKGYAKYEASFEVVVGKVTVVVVDLRKRKAP